MKTYIVDANCLISFVTDRDAKQQEIMQDIFASVSNLEFELMIISNVLTEFVYVLDRVYGIGKENISEMISDLLKNPGIIYHHGYYPEQIIQYWPSIFKDFGDAVIATTALELKTPLFTFDQKFSKALTKVSIYHEFLK